MRRFFPVMNSCLSQLSGNATEYITVAPLNDRTYLTHISQQFFVPLASLIRRPIFHYQLQINNHANCPHPSRRYRLCLSSAKLWYPLPSTDTCNLLHIHLHGSSYLLPRRPHGHGLWFSYRYCDGIG